MKTRKAKQTRKVRNLAAKRLSTVDAAQVRGGGIVDVIRNLSVDKYTETAKGMIQSIGR